MTTAVVIAVGLLFVVLIWYWHSDWQKRRAAKMAETQVLAAITSCQVCGSKDYALYTFYHLVFFGIAPFACMWRLGEVKLVLCPEHARETSLACTKKTGLKGYWGFPGILAGPWYVIRNLWALKKTRSLNMWIVRKSIVSGFVVPISLLLACAIVLVAASAVATRLLD